MADNRSARRDQKHGPRAFAELDDEPLPGGAEAFDEGSAGQDDDDAPAERGVDAGGFIGREPELSRPDVPDTALTNDAIPDLGWADPPAGHREDDKVTDDDVRRAG